MQTWLEVSVQVSAELAEAVAEVLSRYAPQGVVIDLGVDCAEGPVTVKAYLLVDDDIRTRRRKVEEAIWHLGQIMPIPEPVFVTIPDQDWTAGWKDSIPVLHLGRIVIKPSWRNYTPQPDEIVLEMDPGLAFGTGLHPTTQLCVAALENASLSFPRAPRSVLDLGTGSGILAIAAAKLGAAQVLAVDNDANAVTAVRRNVRANDVSHKVQVLHGSLSEVVGTYDLILANILAPVIIEMTNAGLAERLRPEGTLVVSGILEEQADEVLSALTQAGLRVTERLVQEDWVALVADLTSD